MPNCNARDSQGRLVYYDKSTGCLTVDFNPQPCYGDLDIFTDDNGYTVSGAQVKDCLLNGVAYPDQQSPPPPVEPPVGNPPPPVDLSGVEQALKDLTTAVNQVAADVGGIANQVSTQVAKQVSSIGDQISGAVSSISNQIGGITGAVTNAVSGVVSQVTGAINGITGTITSEIDRTASATQQAITQSVAGLGDDIHGIGQQISDAVGASAATIRDAVNGIGSQIAQSITDETNAVVAAINTEGGSILTGIEDTLNSILPSLLNTLSANTAALIDFVSGLQSTLATPTDVLTDVKTWINANWPLTFPPILNMLEQAVGPAIKSGLESLEAEALDSVGSTLDLVIDRGSWPDEVKSILVGLRNAGHPVQFIALALLLFEVARQGVGAYVEPWAEQLHKLGMSDARPTIPTLAEVVLAQRRDQADEDDVLNIGRQLGYPDATITALQAISQDRLTTLDYTALYLRGYLDRETLDTKLTGISFDLGEIEHLLNLVKFVPPPTDLIRFLTRDVFIPEFVSRFGMDQEYPALADPFFAKVGIDHDTALQYWEAHWELPSLTQGFEMYHRVSSSQIGGSGDAVQLGNGRTVYRGLSRDDLARLQRAQGVEPFWRDRQLAITFNPLTRVDIRRMNKTGILSDDDIEEQYLNLGYTQENAQRLAAFTIALNKQEVTADLEPWRAGIRGHVTTAFEQGVIGADNLKSALSDLGYTDSQVAAFVAEGELVRAVNFASSARTALKNLYVKGLETADDVRGQLEMLGFDDVEISEYLSLWDIDRTYAELSDEAKAQREATKAEVIAAYKDRILTRSDAEGFLRGLRYADDAVSLLLNLADYQVAAADTATRVSAIKSLYVAGRIDFNNAQTRMDQLALSSERKQAYLDTWSVERQAKSENVPIGLMERLVAAQIIPFGDARNELIAQGYGADRTDQILALFGSDEAKAAVAAKAAEARQAATAAREAAAEARRLAAEQRRTHPVLTAAQIVTSVKDGTFTVDEGMTRLLGLGYSTADAQTLVENAVGPIENAGGVWQMVPVTPAQ